MFNIPIIGTLIEKGFDYFTLSKSAKIEKQKLNDQAKINKIKRADELEQAKHTAQVQRLERQDNTVENYDILALKNAKESWIDELEVIWVLAIITMIFIPSMQEYVITGFKALDKHVPIYFQLVFVGIFISKLGLRFLFRGRSILGK